MKPKHIWVLAAAALVGLVVLLSLVGVGQQTEVKQGTFPIPTAAKEGN